MGPSPYYSQSQVVYVCQSFRPVAQFFFWQSTIFKIFLSMEKGCGHINVLITFPGDTDPKYIYIWVCGLTSIV